MHTVTGPDLRRERRAADLTVTAVASRMGLSRQSVHNIERAAHPATERIEQYRQALSSLRDGSVTA
jgi:transcriptional regulator with XRE-family HTH domain